VPKQLAKIKTILHPNESRKSPIFFQKMPKILIKILDLKCDRQVVLNKRHKNELNTLLGYAVLTVK
jgi:hypothetical protein